MDKLTVAVKKKAVLKTFDGSGVPACVDLKSSADLLDVMEKGLSVRSRRGSRKHALTILDRVFSS